MNLNITQIKMSILNIKNMMSNLQINRNVALYAYDMDLLKCTKNNNERNKIKNEMNHLKEDIHVLEYLDLFDYLINLENQISNYYKYVQIDTRNKLSNNKIYVYQHSNNIISYKSITNPNDIIEDTNNHTVIYPQTDFNSKRKSRHFYNNASFKYLENHTKDYEFKRILTM